MRDNRDGVPCQRAFSEGVDKGIPDLHMSSFELDVPLFGEFSIPFLKAAATELGAHRRIENFAAAHAKKITNGFASPRLCTELSLRGLKFRVKTCSRISSGPHIEI
jgi:hypothetical protein